MKTTRRIFGAVLLMMGALWVTQPVQAAGFIIEPLDYNVPDEVAAAADEGKNLVIMFSLNGCPYCLKMHKRVFPHPEVAAQYNDTFVMFEVNIKGDLDVVTHNGETKAEKEFAEELRVRATPVFVFFSKDGKDVLRLTGYQDPKMFMTAGRYVTSEAFKDGTSFLSFVRSGK